MYKMIMFLALVCLLLESGCDAKKRKSKDQCSISADQYAPVGKLKSFGSSYARGQHYRYVDALGTAKLEQITIDENCNIQGTATLVDVTIGGKLSILGKVKKMQNVRIGADCNLQGTMMLDTVEVAGDVWLLGTAKITELQAERAVEFFGTTNMVKSKIAGALTVHGNIATQSCFLNDISIFVNADDAELFFTNSTIGAVVVKKSHKAKMHWLLRVLTWFGHNEAKEARIVLDGTTVLGDIKFENLMGTVVLKNGAQINGQVIGGTVQLLN